MSIYHRRAIAVNHELANDRQEYEDASVKHALGKLALITAGVGSAFLAIPRIIAVLGFGMSNFVFMRDHLNANISL